MDNNLYDFSSRNNNKKNDFKNKKKFNFKEKKKNTIKSLTEVETFLKDFNKINKYAKLYKIFKK